MGSQNRACEADFVELDENLLMSRTLMPATYRDGKIDDVDACRGVTAPPIPPRQKPHEQNETFCEPDVAPPLPERALASHQSVSGISPISIKRPVLEPRMKHENSHASIHKQSTLIVKESERSVLPNAETTSALKIISSTPKTSQCNSRIILDRGRPTTVIDEGSLEAGNSRSISHHVVQLSLWPERSPSSAPNLFLDVRRNSSKRTNEYVESPSLVPVVTCQIGNELSSVTMPEVTPTFSVIRQAQVEKKTELEEKKLINRSQTQGISSKLETACSDKIICPRCGKCRCKKCTEHQEIPRRWVGQQECSLECAVECCTCLCCAKAVFYHCRSSEEGDYSDNPCGGCDEPQCCTRYAALGLLSVCLPCLCCYWPMRYLVRSCTSCYNRCCRVEGCRCQHDIPLGSKGLLVESESSSF